MFGIGWKDAEATIVQRRLVAQDTHVGGVVGQTVRTYQYVADVRPSDGSQPFRAVVNEPFNAIHFKAPEVGQVVRARYNHKERDEHKVKFDRSDPGIYDDLPGQADKKAVRDAHSPQAQAAWDATLNAPPGSYTPSNRALAADDAQVLAAGTRPDPSQVTHQGDGFLADAAAFRERAAAFRERAAGSADALAAILRAKQSGDQAELERLKTEFANREIQTAPSSATDPLERLQKLADLHDRGALTDAEVAAEKSKLLGD